MISRRTLLGTGAGAASALAAGSLLPRAADAATPSALPAPARSGIDHIVVCMMENRSFDHFLGWLPGARGRQSGLTYRDHYNVPHQTFHLTTPNSCQYSDPDHSYEGGREQLDGGRCDGWLRTAEAGAGDLLPIGYYTQGDLAFLGQAAPYWTTCDRYFSATMAETYPNRFYQHSGRTDRLHNGDKPADGDHGGIGGVHFSALPTIWDRLKAKGVSHKYYYNDIPFLAMWGPKYLAESTLFTQFEIDCAAGTLPAVSFVDPAFLGEGQGTSGDDHPTADIRVGQHFMSRVYDAVTNSPAWKNTLLIFNYDEWGGFFDHVAPGRAPDVWSSTALRGFRVPALVISPRARRRFVAPWTYDHTSILRTIEWRFGLAPLTPRDRYARNIAEVLDFSRPPNLTAPAMAAPPVVPLACAPDAPAMTPAAGTESPEKEWGALRDAAKQKGWDVL